MRHSWPYFHIKAHQSICILFSFHTHICMTSTRSLFSHIFVLRLRICCNMWFVNCACNTRFGWLWMQIYLVVRNTWCWCWWYELIFFSHETLTTLWREDLLEETDGNLIVTMIMKVQLWDFVRWYKNLLDSLFLFLFLFSFKISKK